MFPLFVLPKKKSNGTKRGSRFRSHRHRPDMFNGALSRVSTVLNAINEHGDYFGRMLKVNNLPPCKPREQVQEVPQHVLDFRRSKCCEAWRRGFFGPRESVERPRFGDYAHMVKEIRMPQPVDSKIVSQPKKDIVSSVNVLRLFPKTCASNTRRKEY